MGCVYGKDKAEGRWSGELPGRMGIHSLTQLYWTHTTNSLTPPSYTRALLSPIPGVCGVSHNSTMTGAIACSQPAPPQHPPPKYSDDLRCIALVAPSSHANHNWRALWYRRAYVLGRLRLHCRRKGMGPRAAGSDIPIRT
jgi:hypothetical protein